MICVAASWRRSRTAYRAGQWRSASASPHRRRLSGFSSGAARAASSRGRPSIAVSRGDKRSHWLETHAAAILAWSEETPDITLAEIVAHLQQQHGFAVAPSTVWRLLDRHGLSFKKKAHATEQQRPDVWQRRLAWFEAQPELEPERLVFIDETGAST